MHGDDLELLACSIVEQIETRCVYADTDPDDAKALAITLVQDGIKEGITATIIGRLSEQKEPLSSEETMKRIIMLEAILESLIEHACSYVMQSEEYVTGGHQAVSQGPMPNAVPFKAILAAVERTMRVHTSLPA